MQRIVPYLSYKDAGKAIEFLCRAYGFAEVFRYPMKDGRIGHAEIALGGDSVFLASSTPGFGTSPLDLDDVHGQVWVRVDDVDAHFARAKAAGATVTAEPTNEHGLRRYRTTDLEGHRWVFTQPLEEK